MKKTAIYPAGLSISRNAYKRFVDRILKVYLPDVESADVMISALDAYLSGGLDAVSITDASMRTAFAFLRQEIDVAIERSRRARERARIRKNTREEAQRQTRNVQRVATCEESPVAVEVTTAEPKAESAPDAKSGTPVVVEQEISSAELSAPDTDAKEPVHHSDRPAGNKDRRKRLRIKFRKARK